MYDIEEVFITGTEKKQTGPGEVGISMANLKKQMKELIPKLRQEGTHFIVVIDAVNEVGEFAV